MKECCATCKKRLNLTKFDYSKGGCEHTKLDGYVCLAFAYEGEAVWMVGEDENIGLCECYQEKERET